MLAIAIQNLAPDFKYTGSCTENTEDAFDSLVSIDGSKPLWSDIEAEMGRLNLINIEKNLEAALDAHIDSVAQSKDASGKQRYDNRITACLRAAAPNSPWYAEGVAFIEWMDTCYAQAYQLMNDVKNGLAEIPTEEQLISGLPEMVWPE